MNFSGPASNRPTNMAHSFSRVPTINIERSKFDRSHSVKTTFDANYLIPILVDEIQPGDTLNCRLSAFVRMTTPIKPIMDNLYLDTFFFYIPNRLLWTNWEKFCGAQTDPGDSISFTVPTIPMAAGGPEVGTLADYFGIPTDQTNGFSVAAFHFRGYNLVYNTFFRDQNLQDSLVVDVDDGPDTYADYVLKKRGKRHDYFTSALPWPQKGDAVTLGLSDAAPVVLVPHTESTNLPSWKGYADGTTKTGGSHIAAKDGTVKEVDGDVAVVYDPNGRLEANLSNVAAFTVNALREAFQTQVLLERDARGGTRYIEILASQFGVKSPDFRLQRPEYLGGGSTLINVHPVPQTSPTSGSNPQGQLAAFGTASVNGHGFNKSFVEHGIIIGLANVRADLTYSQGLGRMWSRSTRYDYPWPAFNHLGEQAVLNKEIYNDLADGTAANQRSGVFGYQERYAEYRYKPSMITGLFRPAYSAPLDTWHVSQEFSAQPTLNAAFIEEDTPVDRVVAVPSEPHFFMDAFFTYIHARPLPVFAVPGFGDRL